MSRQLTETGTGDRDRVVRFLQSITDPSTTLPVVRGVDKGVLVSIARDTSLGFRVRAGALALLGQIADAEVVALLRQFAQEGGEIGAQAAMVLGRINTSEAEKALLSLLNTPDARTRRWVVRALGSRGRCYPAVLQAMRKETDPGTISAFLTTPTIPPRPDGVPLVLEFLKLPDETVRLDALVWLGWAYHLGILRGHLKAQVVAALTDLLARNPASRVRDKAHELLAWLS